MKAFLENMHFGGDAGFAEGHVEENAVFGRHAGVGGVRGVTCNSPERLSIGAFAKQIPHGALVCARGVKEMTCKPEWQKSGRLLSRSTGSGACG